jgi:hypothetical protein
LNNFVYQTLTKQVIFIKKPNRFAEQLTERFKLNLKIYQSAMNPARMEAKYGKLWERNEAEALNLYDRICKKGLKQECGLHLNTDPTGLVT